MSTTNITFPIPAVTPEAMTVTPTAMTVTPSAVTPPPLVINIVDTTKGGIAIAQNGTTLTVSDNVAVTPPPPPPVNTYQFPVGSTVALVATAAVRNAPNADGSAGTPIGQESGGATGTVKSTPIKGNNNFNWLEVAFSNLTGYVGDDNLKAGGSNPQTPQS